MTQNHKILVVDDEADWLGTCRHELEKAGYAVVTAGGGEAAIETLKQGGPLIHPSATQWVGGVEALGNIARCIAPRL